MKKFDKLMSTTKQAIRKKHLVLPIRVQRDNDGNWIAWQDDTGIPGLVSPMLYVETSVPPEIAMLMENAFQLGVKTVRNDVKGALGIS